MGQHLVDSILQLRPEDVPVVLRTHVGESTDGTRIILLTSEWDMKYFLPSNAVSPGCSVHFHPSLEHRRHSPLLLSNSPPNFLKGQNLKQLNSQNNHKINRELDRVKTCFQQ